MLKIYGIVKLKTDFIFVSDVRISNKNLVSARFDIEKMLRCNSYEKYSLLANSTKNKRGVALLIKSSLDININRQWDSPSENILAVSADLRGEKLLLIAIYGPNNIDNTFFTELDTLLAQYRDHTIIIGGDWNCTVSTNNVNSNIDCINMQNIPNKSHSRKLADLCRLYNLVDPYRYIYPERCGYTYCPRSNLS
jgi:exonuclease III